MRWRRQDAGYAAATMAATGLVAYLVVANFGLVPSPFTPRGADGGRAIDVPTFGAVLAAAEAPAPASVPQIEAPTAAPGGGPRPAANAPAADPTPAAPTPEPDRLPPSISFSTPAGAVISPLEKATINGTAEDAGSGVRDVQVTFDSSAGDPTTVDAQLTCDAGRRNCSWRAEAPSVAGSYSIGARVRDRAGNTSQALPIAVTVVNGGGLIEDLVTGSDEGDENQGGLDETLQEVVRPVTNLVGNLI